MTLEQIRNSIERLEEERERLISQDWKRGKNASQLAKETGLPISRIRRILGIS